MFSFFNNIFRNFFLRPSAFVLRRSALSERNRVYLDNAGATEISERAKRSLTEALSLYGNPSAIHKEGDIASRLLDKARNICAKILNAHAYEIYFVGSGTESCNLAVLGTYLGSIENWKLIIENSETILPHVIVSAIEHPAVLEPIRYLEKEGKIRVTYLPVYENGIVKLNDIREALTPETILVSVMYANNEIGTIQPVKEIGRAIEEWKKENNRTHTDYPYFHIDACQAVNYCNLDVVRLRAHLMTVNSSKCYGPKGIALLYKREGIKVEPTTLGGGQERGMRSGTESVALASSFAEALTESTELKEKEGERLEKLRDFFFENILKEIPDVTIYGDKKDRLLNNINIRVPGILSDEMIIRLDAKGFAVSHKSACASSESDGSYVLEALGASREEALQNIRITLGRSTSKQDLDNLIKAIKEIVSKYVK
ncbi:MAG: cysteine desulfurase family protein [Candidatus Nomurabacteria bacterium]